MNSLYFFEMKETIKNYLKEQQIPAELKRMLLAEVLEDITADARREIIAEAEARENKKQEETNNGL